MSVSPEMSNFYRDIVKAHTQHSGKDEFITYHGPENHGGHGEHSQFTFVNTTLKSAGKIRLPTDSK